MTDSRLVGLRFGLFVTLDDTMSGYLCSYLLDYPTRRLLRLSSLRLYYDQHTQTSIIACPLLAIQHLTCKPISCWKTSLLPLDDQRFTATPFPVSFLGPGHAFRFRML